MKTLFERGPLSPRARAFVIFLIGVAASGVALLLVYAVVSSAINSSQTNERGESREGQVAQNDELLEIIKDCTDVNGKCAKKNRENLAKAIANIDTNARRTAALAAACAAQVSNPTQPQEILDCMNDYLKEGIPSGKQ